MRTEKRREYERKWQSTHREACREATRKWRLNHPEEHRISWRKRNGAKTPSGEIKYGNCPICKKENTRLDYDHDHITGEFRGWICHTCNCSLGFAKDNIEILKNLIRYLENYRAFKVRKK